MMTDKSFNAIWIKEVPAYRWCDAANARDLVKTIASGMPFHVVMQKYSVKRRGVELARQTFRMLYGLPPRHCVCPFNEIRSHSHEYLSAIG